MCGITPRAPTPLQSVVGPPDRRRLTPVGDQGILGRVPVLRREPVGREFLDHREGGGIRPGPCPPTCRTSDRRRRARGTPRRTRPPGRGRPGPSGRRVAAAVAAAVACGHGRSASSGGRWRCWVRRRHPLGPGAFAYPGRTTTRGAGVTAEQQAGTGGT